MLLIIFEIFAFFLLHAYAICDILKMLIRYRKQFREILEIRRRNTVAIQREGY